MISRLTGTIAHVDMKYLIIDVGGVGYKVFTTANVLGGMGKLYGKNGQAATLTANSGATGATAATTPVTLFTYLAVRDDALDLYGFANTTELAFFELLISISGIGPKSALGILNIASVEALDRAIRTSDTTHLIKVSGVSKKMAEKIVMELKDKIETVSIGDMTSQRSEEDQTDMRADADVVEALKALGYTPNEARDALKKIDKDIKKTGEKVKAALKLLA